MKKPNLHSQPEDSRTFDTVSAIEKTTKSIEQNTEAIKALHPSIKNKNVEMDGFTGVIKTLKKTNEAIKDPQPEKIVRKLEEIKSASLITNKHLKDISSKETPEPKDFPTSMEVSLKGISLVKIKG